MEEMNWDNVIWAQVSWCVADIKELRPEWTDEECADFLDYSESRLVGAMIEHGWIILESMLNDY